MVLRKGVIEISPGRIRALVSGTTPGSAEWPSGRLFEVEYRVSPLEASPRNIRELIERAADEVRAVGGEDPEVVMVGDLRGTRLPALVERIARGAGLGPVRLPSRREQIEGAFLAATGNRSPGAGPGAEVAVAVLADAFTGLAVGTPGFLPGWTASRPLTARGLVDRARFSDPPTEFQLEAATSAAARSLGSLVPPEPSGISLVSRKAPALVSLCGAVVDSETTGRALGSPAVNLGSDAPAVGHLSRKERLELAATLVICRTLSARFGMPLEVMVPDLALSRALLERAGTTPRQQGRGLR